VLNLNFEKFEKGIKNNKIFSLILIPLFIVSIIFSITDTGNRLVTFVKSVVGYEATESVEVNGKNKIEKRLHLAKLEATKYKIPSSSMMVVKFISLPFLNEFGDKNAINSSMAATISPIKPVSGDIVFDGADCRVGIKAESFNKASMKASFGITFISCTDNKGVAYSYEPEHSIGYLSELLNPAISNVSVNDDGGYLTIFPENNYLVQLYEPIESIDKRGISLFGRF
jgi:hypothetical protein